jgi:hypothetical protein
MNQYKAGAGLPNIERLVIKYMLVPIVRLLFTWNISLFLIKKEENKIKKLIKNISKENLQKRVFIKRALAIEDHSRDYSINMCLEHLRITGSALMGVIETLSCEKEFTRPITIEAVKPKENTLNEAEKFFEFMDKYKIYIKNHKKNYSKMTKAHPWFVNFNNSDWACFMFMHTFIHRRQIQAIIKDLK